MTLVQAELRRAARYYLARERADHTLQPTALVNEVYVRLAGQREFRWQNRAQFIAVAAHHMRFILVDHARKRKYAKRDAGVLRVTLSENLAVI
jgi:RNA polymerase sigma factor (TIGR02999 family)